MIHVIKHIPRPDSALVEKLSRHGSATVHEAMGRVGAMERSIKPLARGMKICGPAFTVRAQAGDNVMILKAMREARRRHRGGLRALPGERPLRGTGCGGVPDQGAGRLCDHRLRAGHGGDHCHGVPRVLQRRQHCGYGKREPGAHQPWALRCCRRC